jgi:hypothetical protein
MKRFDDARREAKIGVELAKGVDPHVGTALDVVIAVMEDDRETVRRLLPELEKNAGGIYSEASWIADLHFYLGGYDDGFAWLERSYSSKDSGLVYIKTDEFLECVHSDPRYLDLLGRLGLE